MVIGYRIGTIQRGLLKRGQRWTEKPTANHPEVGESSGQVVVDLSPTDASRKSLESMDRDDASAHAVEIVRPPEVNLETTLYTRFLLESYLGQFHRQHQAHLHHAWQQEHGNGGEPGEGQGVFKGVTEVKGEEESIAHNQEDPLKESSFKFEVPIDTPLEPAAAGPSSLSPARNAQSSHAV
ncbi:hypothetical protein BGZ72_009001, partial [Mortierella alpina]